MKFPSFSLAACLLALATSVAAQNMPAIITNDSILDLGYARYRGTTNHTIGFVKSLFSSFNPVSFISPEALYPSPLTPSLQCNDILRHPLRATTNRQPPLASPS